MSPRSESAEIRPPQQARSRAALQKLLTAAEDVLVNQGLDDFTIAAVAEHAGVSVGGVYRRFAGREQLIDAVVERMLGNLEDTVAESLNTAEPSLAGVITAFSHALADSFTRSGRVASTLIAGQRTPEMQQRGLGTATAMQHLFLDAAAPYTGQITHPAPATALNSALRSIIAAGAHRAATNRWWPDELTWSQWADEIADMATTYLTAWRRQKP
jgi:AcrR family transcriptional regulator